MKDLEEEFSAAVGAFSLTGPILSFTLAIIPIASGTIFWLASSPYHGDEVGMGQNLVPLVNLKIAGNTHKWLLIGIDP
jgi:hypothetical protein